MMVRSVVVLPAPLRPTRQTSSRAPTSSVDLAQDLARLDGRRRALDAEHARGACVARVGGGAARPAVSGARPMTVATTCSSPPDTVGRAVGEHPALVQGHDAVRVGEHDVHVVLDLDDGLDAGLPRRRHQRLHDGGLVAGAHAAGRLVEQDDLGAQGEGAGHVEQLLVALRERARGHAQGRREAEEVGDGGDPRPNLGVAGQRGPQRRPRPSRDTTATASVSATVNAGEDVDELEAARHAEGGQADGADAGDVPPLEAHGAGARAQQPGQDVDEGGLAGPVGTDDRDELARRATAQTARRRGRRSRRRSLRTATASRSGPDLIRALPARPSIRPMRPWGKKMTTTARMAPKTKRQYSVSDITWSLRKMKTKAPRSGPKKLAKPPRSSMKTRLPECVQ